jgi:DNA-binding MarR family transcriptional regulator
MTKHAPGAQERFHDAPGFSICRAARKIRRHLEGCFEPWGVTPPQWSALRFIGEGEGGVKQARLAELLEKDANNVKTIVDRLEEKKLVERRPDGRDARVWRLALSKEGEALYAEVSAIDDSFLEGLVQGVSDRDLAVFRRVLKRIEANAL